jgi:hypothetical protein
MEYCDWPDIGGPVAVAAKSPGTRMQQVVRLALGCPESGRAS